MNKFKLIKSMLHFIKTYFISLRNKSGSALILTMFILAGMLIVAMSGSYIVLAGIKAGGIQSQSTKAYFAAEAGTERFLFELRRNGYETNNITAVSLFSETLPVSLASYNIYFTSFPPLTYTAIGDFQKTKRSVEVSM